MVISIHKNQFLTWHCFPDNVIEPALEENYFQWLWISTCGPCNSVCKICFGCPRMVLCGPWKSHSIKHLNFLYSPLIILTKRRPLLTVAFCNYPMGCIVFDLCCDKNYPKIQKMPPLRSRPDWSIFLLHLWLNSSQLPGQHVTLMFVLATTPFMTSW